MTAPLPVSDFDRSSIGEILADQQGKHWNWFSCHLFRLMARADGDNMLRLAIAYPEHVRAFVEWQLGPLGPDLPVLPCRNCSDGCLATRYCDGCEQMVCAGCYAEHNDDAPDHTAGKS